MKKFIKNYFLFFSVSPVIFSIVFYVVYILFTAFVVHSHDTTSNLLGVTIELMIAAVIVFINFLAVELVILNYITRPISSSHKYANALFTVLVTKDGERLLLDKSLWAKGKKYFIFHPDYTDCEDETIDFIFENESSYKNLTFIIDFKMSFYLSAPYDKLKLFDLLVAGYEDEERLDLGDYILSVFDDSNPNQQELVDQALSQFVESDPEALTDVAKKIIMPNDIFSTTERVETSFNNLELLEKN